MNEERDHTKDQTSSKNIYIAKEDTVIPFQVEELDTRGRAVQLGESLNSILTKHQYPEPVSCLLAEALTLTVLLGTSLKFEGKFILQTHSDGPVNMLVCDFSTPSNLRGYARFNEEKIQQAIANNQTSSEMLLGKGTLAFTIDQGSYTQRYQGIVALDGSSLQEAAHSYFKQSEQIPTAIRLAVGTLIYRDQQGKQKKSWRAGGILTQFLPQASPHRKTFSTNQQSEDFKTRAQLEDQWREVEAFIATIDNTELTDPQVSTEKLLFRLFHERGVKVFKEFPIIDQCSCSREKTKEILNKFSPNERTQMIENQQISVTCEFCSTSYHFQPQELADAKG
ncbi:Hsp33 family molecular chaperone [Bartonella sp. F02]|uniref:Hsp33 family molecular chaperone n=1 Tax=Bartonella sp. F02 TaxID=2967262 RepID=UPI0022A92E12|nr:Hsp33 family molecular chaperone [Bartonella sp. F02]MCZ2328021.1 Hsp33 family molecular chaperone [Bartonella sp. F02]